MTDEAKRCVEILRYCSTGNDRSHCKGCPYYFRDTKGKPCINVLWEKAADLIESTAAELEQVKRERDAAVEDIKKATIYLCNVCKSYRLAVKGEMVHSCEKVGEHPDFNGAIACSMFEWRGVKEGTNGQMEMV